MEKDNLIVKFLRLKTGEDVVSELVEIGENDKTYYQLINPVKVVYMPTERPGYVQVAIMPWVFSRVCDIQEFTISADDVLMVSDVSQFMHEYYWNTMEGEDKEESEPEPEDNKLDLETLKELMDQISSKRKYH